jgi:hypothetical protein
MAIWYIDPDGDDDTGDGSIENPWQSLYKACSTVTSSGDTIHVNVGDYTESHNCDVSIGVNIEGVGDTSNIVFTHAATNWEDACIRLVSLTEGTVGNQSISYLYLDGNDDAAYHGILVRCRGSVNIHHCTMIHFHYSAVNFNGKDHGFQFGDPPDIWSENNSLYNCTITDCANCSAIFDGDTYRTHGHGNIRVCGQENISIYNNILTQTGGTLGNNANIVDAVEGENIAVKYYNNISYKPDITDTNDWNMHWEDYDCRGGYQMYDNEFHGGDQMIDFGGYFAEKGDYEYAAIIHHNLFALDNKVAEGGPRVKMGVNLENAVTDIKVYDNHFKNLPNGMQIAYTTGSGGISNIQVYNNIFEQMGFTTNGWCSSFNIGLGGGTIDNIYIYNNVIQSSTVGQTMCAFMFNPAGGEILNVYLRNNIILNNNNAVAPIYVRTMVGDFTNLWYDHNLRYNNGSNEIAYEHGGDAIENFYNTDNHTGDPLFVGGSPYDFSLQGSSPAIGEGTWLDITYDYKDYLWKNPPSCGAYEYGSGPSNALSGKIHKFSTNG